MTVGSNTDRRWARLTGQLGKSEAVDRIAGDDMVFVVKNFFS